MRTLFSIFIITCIFFSCRKDDFTDSSEAVLKTSVDTVHFDTLFTTSGSVTQSFKIVNDNDKGIRINSIKLAGGAASPFKINADGFTGPNINGVEIKGNDSTYVFVTVTINPSAADLPFIVRDSIEIVYNGNKTFVQLDAFGQNAHFFRNKKITANESWNNDLPYVILGALQIEENTTLTINEGCKIFLHADAPILVSGTLQVNGKKWDSTKVVFAGDRLDVPYRDFPAGWPGILFMEESKNSVINYAVIKNAYQAIVVNEPATNASPKLTINQTVIDNAYDAGMLAINSSINAQNVLVSNCGKPMILAKGGTYNFTHCTVVGLSNNYIQHKDPALFLTNYISQNNVITSNNLNANFTNCIFWGEANGIVENEVVVRKSGNNSFNVKFDHVLWRVKTNPENSNIIQAINTNTPLFDSINHSQKFYSFKLKETSPAINKGVNTAVSLDLQGNPRPVGLPDLGAYEKQ